MYINYVFVEHDIHMYIVHAVQYVPMYALCKDNHTYMHRLYGIYIINLHMHA